jgi:mannose-1-phosphate guanylyltransferase / mannose-6-phosphate isomerase
MREMKITPVILCGGAGTRLWPASREAFPKQFMPLLGDHSTFDDALARVSDTNIFNPPMIMTAEGFRFIIADILREKKMHAHIILEPMRRDSGAAIAAAAEIVGKGLMLVLAADHAVKEHDKFVQTALKAAEIAKTGRIVTFGIIPTEPSTGYGYIEANPDGSVKRFVEKPDATRAREFIEKGYLWNSGNFLFPAEIFLEELAKFEPEMAQAAKGAAKTQKDITANGQTFHRLNAEEFAKSPSKSVDFAVMERTDKASVIKADYHWSDLGSWNAIYDLLDKDEKGNVIKGNARAQNSDNCYIDSNKLHTVVIGQHDLAVIVTEDAVLIAPRHATSEIKELVTTLKREQSPLTEEHPRVYRPWGWYHSIENGATYQVKRICVMPGARLSLQTHKFRAENWVSIKGTATVEVDDLKINLTVNQSVFIPLGAVHRLSNETNEPIEIIEVQNGSYLGEDDIVRLEDDYKRV